ncbi:MAG: hypothetical protein Q4G06_01260 [Clostridia bacterium]|nr:hypothetical protein [Clostridia bacterium]
MTSEMNHIPDYSRAAISEGCDAALLRAAFLQLEEEEIMKTRSMLNCKNHDAPERLAFARSLRRRARRRAARQAVARALPRTLQAAACLIAVLSVGMGVALATSSAARSWAAGVLHAEIYEETNLFSDTGRVPTQYFGDEPLSGFRGGAALGDALYLVGGINSDDDIYVQTPGDAQYTIYKGNADEECELMNLTAFEDGLYALCAEGTENDWFSEEADACSAYSVGRLRFAEGSYTVEDARTIERSALFGDDPRKPASASVRSFCADGDFIYLLSEWAYPAEDWSGEIHCRLLRLNPATGALDALELPEGKYLGWEGDLSAFSGGDGRAYLALSENEAETSRILRIEPDGSLTAVAELAYRAGSRPCAFAMNAEGDMLYYLQERCIYAAPVSDPAQARAITTTGQTYGNAVRIGDDALAIVNELSAQIYVLSDVQAEITRLCVDGSGGNYDAETAFAEAHPGVNLVGDPCYAQTWRDRYVDAILAGQSQADVWLIQLEDVPLLLDAGVYAQIDDPELIETASRMYPGLQREMQRDGKLAAVPLYGWTYLNFSFDPEVMQVLNLSEEALPETWPELLELLIELSRDPQAQRYCLNSDYADADAFSRTLFNRICSAYLRLCRYEGRDVDFSDPRFEAVANLWRQIDFDAFRYVRRDMPDNTVEGALLYSDSVIANADWAVPCPLRFDAASPRVSGCSGLVAIVNPETQNMALACDYIRCYFGDGIEDLERISFDLDSDPDELTDEANLAERIPRMRELTGDLTVVPSITRTRPDAWTQADEAARAFASGEISFGELSEALNASLS